MVSAPTQPPLPPLSEHESELLSSFMILRFDMVALAEANKLLPTQLLAFAQSPAVAAQLATLKKFAQEAFELRSLESRTGALGTLDKISKHSEDPIEQRRAASTILRGLGLQRASRPPSPASGGGGAAFRGGGGSVSTRSTHAPSFDNESFPPGAPHNGSASPLHPPTSSPIHPPPQPSPALTPRDVIKHAVTIIEKPQDPGALPTLHHFLAPEALINNQPTANLNESELQHQLLTLSPTRPVVQKFVDEQQEHSPGPPETHTSNSYYVHESRPSTAVRISLTRAPSGPHAGSWLIASLDRKPDSS